MEAFYKKWKYISKNESNKTDKINEKVSEIKISLNKFIEYYNLEIMQKGVIIWF